jgi:MFS family permease
VAGNLAMVLGAVIGGLILIRTGATKDGYRFVFLASSALRFIASLSIVFFIGEIRVVKRIPYRLFAGIFFQAAKDRGIFYVPDVLKNRPR